MFAMMFFKATIMVVLIFFGGQALGEVFLKKDFPVMAEGLGFIILSLGLIFHALLVTVLLLL